MKKVALLSFLFVFLCSFSAFSADKFVLFMVDASGSMSQQLQGRMKMDIAKDAISSVLEEIPDTIPMGLRAYGHKFDRDRSDQENCLETELLVPIEKGTKVRIIREVNKLQPRGHTPIAYSLSKAPEDFPHFDAERIIILVSDGKETCGGDPIAVINDLKRRGFKFVVHTVGFDVDEETRRQLKGIADASGGKYMDAGSAQELGESLKTVTEEIRQKITFGEDAKRVQPGRGFGDAGLIQQGEMYAYNILPGETHFYKFGVEKGDKVTATVTMKRHNKGTPKIIGLRYIDNLKFEVDLYDPDRGVVKPNGSAEETIEHDELNPVSVRVKTAGHSEDKGMPFAGDAFVAISLDWISPQESHTTRGECTYTLVVRIEKAPVEEVREKHEDEEEGQAITPGNGFSSATLIKPDITYKVEDGIAGGEVHYYKFKVKKGDQVIVTYTLKNADAGSDKGFCIGHFIGKLYDPDRMEMVKMGSGGFKSIGRGEKSTQRFATNKGQYGSVAEGMPFDGEGYLTFNYDNREDCVAPYYTFKIRIESTPEEQPAAIKKHIEEGKRIEGGGSFSKATVIKPNVLYNSQISPGETDYYKMKVKEGYMATVLLRGRWEDIDERRKQGLTYLDMTAFDEDWVEQARSVSLMIRFDDTELKTVRWEPRVGRPYGRAFDKDATWYLTVARSKKHTPVGWEKEGISTVTNYTLEVKMEKAK